jgi:hypothetical protein
MEELFHVCEVYAGKTWPQETTATDPIRKCHVDEYSVSSLGSPSILDKK